MRAITDDTRTNILNEQFVPDNLFIYITKGAVQVFDGNQNYIFKAGDSFIARKNTLVKYKLLDNKEVFEPILFCFDDPFLKEFQEKKGLKRTDLVSKETFIGVQKSELMESFIQSVKPYYIGTMQLDEAFEDLKYEELLIILLKNQPDLTQILFDFRNPGKIDLEEFMMKNYKFNVSLERFAYLTGRSLSSFKRDFKMIFNQTPSHWLVQKRLEEASFLISNNCKKPSDIYLDLGFESLSHFSFAFKKQFGFTPTELSGKAGSSK